MFQTSAESAIKASQDEVDPHGHAEALRRFCVTGSGCEPAADSNEGSMAAIPVNHRSSSRRREPDVQGTLGVSQQTQKRRKETPVEQQREYVGIDLHRRRSVIVRITASGEVLETVRVDNDPLSAVRAVMHEDPNPEVALEATYRWYWAADLLQAEGATVHLVHPLGLHWDSRRVKNDERDATELAERLRRGDLPEAWIAPPELRELRELVRYRAKLTGTRQNDPRRPWGVEHRPKPVTEPQGLQPTAQRVVQTLIEKGST
jgi:hypothetical protein